MVDTVDKVIIEYQSQNFDKTSGDVKTLTGNLSGLTEVSFTAEKSTSSLENKFASLERRFQTTAAQSAQYEKIQKDVNLAVSNNPALQGRANDVLAAAAAKYGVVGEAAQAAGARTKLASYELINLGRQAQDVAVSLFSGQSPLTVGVQQGSQIFDVYASSGVKFSDSLKQIGGIARGILSPVVLLTGGVVALGAAAAYAALQYDKVNVAAQRAISGAGARTGTTVSDLNAFVDKNTPSVTTGAGLSQKESRALGEGLTQTGDIVISKLHSMSDAVTAFSNQSGKSMDDSVKAFVQMGKDPVKAMDELANVFGPFSQKTRDLAEAAAVSGDKTRAWNVVLDELGKTARESAGNMTTAEKAARGLFNVLQTGPRATGLETQLENARAKLNSTIENAPTNLGPDDARLAAYSQALQRVNAEFEALYARQQAVIDQKASSTFDDLGNKARLASEALGLGNQKINEAITALNQLKAARDAGVQNLDSTIMAQTQYVQLLQTAKAETAMNVQQVALLAERWGSVNAATNLALQSLQDQINVAKARTDQEKESAEFQANVNKLKNEGKKTDEEAVQIASKMRELTRAQADSQKDVSSAASDSSSSIDTGAAATQRAAAAALQWQQNMLGVGAAAIAAADSIDAAMDAQLAAMRAANPNAGTFNPDVMPSNGGTLDPNGPYFSAYYRNGGAGMRIGPFGAHLKRSPVDTQMSSDDLANAMLSSGGVDAAIQSVKSSGGADAAQTLSSLYDLKNGSTNDNQIKAANLTDELSWLKSQPQTLDIGKQIISLQQSIDQLKTSTDGLTSVNQDLLSPYYTQDPRTSHIGFRSQGMADGGYLTVPGSPSANDNMVAEIPMASSERLYYVDPMNSGRGRASSGGGGTTISISMPITIQGGANKDEVGRTMYQAGQNMARQLAAAGR